MQEVNFGLNMMTSGPNLIIIAKIAEEGQEPALLKTKHMKAIGEGTNTYLLTKLSYDVEE
jgi:hypothetical protein